MFYPVDTGRQVVKHDRCETQEGQLAQELPDLQKMEEELQQKRAEEEALRLEVANYKALIERLEVEKARLKAEHERQLAIRRRLEWIVALRQIDVPNIFAEIANAEKLTRYVHTL